MKLIGLSDIHISSKQPIGRSDDYFMAGLLKLEYIYSKAHMMGARILQTGDYVDRTRDWFVLPMLVNLFKQYKVKTYVVPGQHDMYYRNTEEKLIRATTMGILQETGFVKFINNAVVLSTPEEKHGTIIYGAGWKKDIPKKSSLEKDDDYRILITHSSISMNKEPHVSITGAKSYAKKYKNRFDLIVCGDIHKAFKYTIDNCTIINTGPMLRKEATEYNFTHAPHFYVIDTIKKTLTKKYIPYASAEDVLLRDHIDREKEIKSIMDDLVEAIEDAPDEIKSDVLSNLYEYIKKIKASKNVVNVIERIIDDAEQD